MTEAACGELVVLPPIADDPIFAEELFGESVAALEVLTEVSSDLPKRPGNDPHDFAALFMRHRWSFALHARRFLQDERDVDEVVQEGFLRLFLAMPELETELQVLAYCRRTITNLCIDRYRADQRRPRLLDLETVPVDVLPDEDEVDPVVQAEDAAIVRQALAMLSPLHREALIKREVEEKPLPQIAAELDITVEQTKHLLHRARRSLRRLLVGTHVEPGVDLDFATVLAVNRERAVRVAKPTGAAVVALLLVIAGVVGLRPSGGRPANVAAAPSDVTGPLRGEPAAPRAPHTATPQKPIMQPPSTTTVVPRKHTRSPSSSPSRPVLVPPAVPSQPAAGKPGNSGGGPRPPAVVPPATQHAFVVSGVGASGAAQVADQQRAFRAAGITSSSTISAATVHGTYALRQAFTFSPDGALSGVQVQETVPTSTGETVTTSLQGSSTTSEVAADGTVHLVTTGSSAPVEPGSTLEQARSVTLDLVLDAQHVRVLNERVTVQGGLPAPTGEPAASPLLVAAASTPGSAVLESPTAPRSSAGDGPRLRLGSQDPTRLTYSLLDQQPATGYVPDKVFTEGDDERVLPAS